MAQDLRLRELRISEVLARYQQLRLVPTKDGVLSLGGTISFEASALGSRTISDSYEITIRVPGKYPFELPIIYETSGRIPKNFHKLEGNALCLGAPIRLRLLTHRNPSLLNFIEGVIVPYLYGYSLFEAGEAMPFGELRHGTEGLLDDWAEMLGFADSKVGAALLQAVKQKKRIANKRDCPCGSGLRLGCCHNRKANALRIALHPHLARRHRP